MDDMSSRLSQLTVGGGSSTDIVYLLEKKDDRASYFVPGSDEFLVSRTLSRPEEFEVGNLYRMKIGAAGVKEFSEIEERELDVIRNRGGFKIPFSDYHNHILRILLLGSRVRDYEQSCATVIQLSGPLILTTGSRVNAFLTTLTLRTEMGRSFEVQVENVNRENPKSCKIFAEPKTRLPSRVEKNSRLQIVSDTERVPLVTTALMSIYDGTRSISSSTLLDCVYGKRGSEAYADVDRTLLTVTKAKGDRIVLNGEQTEAVRRYLSSCPAFAVESPPGSGKTMTAAAMAISYKDPGVQLFLSTANIPVYNIACAIEDLDYGDKEIVHLLSAEWELSGKKSPFSIMQTVEDDDAVDRFNELWEELEGAISKSAQRRIKQRMRSQRASAISSLSRSYDIILATVDMILAKLMKKKNPELMKKKNPEHPCCIQKLLETSVRRIVVDEASQLTEAAFNALVLCFPHAQIVLIGDTKQLPPFKYTKDDLVSEMAATSALEVLKRKGNVPAITLRTVYRAAPSLMKSYSDVFYDGQLVSGKPESKKNLIACIHNSLTSRSIFLQVKGKTGRFGTSLYNDQELNVLDYLIKKLRISGYDHSRVMIIAYYEAQRKLAEGRVPAGYEVLTVDSAQGREKDIVIVLTTRDSVTDTPFFSCPLRCNVAVSRQKEALIVVGHETLLEGEPWKKLLKKEYFQTLVYNCVAA